jgi:preprotein translocase subunit SecG
VDILIPLITVCHIVIAVLLVITVLLQPGKGGDLGSMFGGGMSDSIFGSSGAVPFLTKTTRVLAVLFIVTSLSLGFFLTRDYKSSVVKDEPAGQFHDEFEEIPKGAEPGTQDVSSKSPGAEGDKSSSAGEASETIPKEDSKN